MGTLSWDGCERPTSPRLTRPPRRTATIRPSSRRCSDTSTTRPQRASPALWRCCARGWGSWCRSATLKTPWVRSFLPWAPPGLGRRGLRGREGARTQRRSCQRALAKSWSDRICMPRRGSRPWGRESTPAGAAAYSKPRARSVARPSSPASLPGALSLSTGLRPLFTGRGGARLGQRPRRHRILRRGREGPIAPAGPRAARAALRAKAASAARAASTARAVCSVGAPGAIWTGRWERSIRAHPSGAYQRWAGEPWRSSAAARGG
mmetsp:Transcript_32651/g.104059  ORF Transcript_32651/g.104059 Transcript_32651/m.104059 type:complete len:264 (-) Transcript_32651:348-1139(-)